ncbi:MAG: isochorismatase family protein [Actinomycetota bacterium]|nr:isochorismatase family protein [Actinomycetota bacterium]
MAEHVSFDAETALLVVDVQNDFVDPDGGLYVTGAEEVVEPINGFVAAARDGGATVVMTQDWHPPSTPHFVDDGGTWPVHCVRSTWGALLHPALSVDADLVLRKGTGGEDGYSAFTVRDPRSGEERSTGLAAYLRDRSITRVVVCGIAQDVCVYETAADAVRLGFRTEVLADATRPVDLTPGDGARRLDELDGMGALVLGAS